MGFSTRTITRELKSIPFDICNKIYNEAAQVAEDTLEASNREKYDNYISRLEQEWSSQHEAPYEGNFSDEVPYQPSPDISKVRKRAGFKAIMEEFIPRYKLDTIMQTWVLPQIVAWVARKPLIIAEVLEREEGQSATGKPATIEGKPATGKPATIEGNAATGKPATIEGNPATGKPATGKPATIEGQTATIEGKPATGKPATGKPATIEGKPATIEGNAATGKPATIEGQRKISGIKMLDHIFDRNSEWDLGLYRFLMLDQRSAYLQTQYKGDARQFCALVPLIMYAFKLNHGIKYSQWSKRTLHYVVNESLHAAMTCEVPENLTVEELLEARDTGLVYKTGAKAGETRNPLTTYKLYDTKGTRIHELPDLAKTMLTQIWCAHPKNRTKYMVLDPKNWDSLPSPLVPHDVFNSSESYTPAAVKNTAKRLPWDE